ncbi:MAG: peptidyl-prolyl cis-trans isomerase [Crocinitomicaceae bacterium]|nr:peptidyl-prolyl cis-trans isomerase [Crocinitomicaceae bacterium]MCF8410759.1 peptidyl-prolyl cis-trans isomerase [Crocinitomicaceae bacterium]MCF8444113.1 peptidyl-prolyl cis-trans isomerase [Crocinitomicaceae bacterium]
MKKQLLTFSFMLLITSGFCQNNTSNDPIVMEIDGKGVTKSEFLQIYLKNNNNPQFHKDSIDKYLVLFKKFKLKVAEAEALGYDTIPKLKKELDGYKKQLANPYMIDSAQNESLVREAYERTANEVRASHILIRLEQNAKPQDTLIAWNKISEIKRRLEKGEDFAYIAKSKNGSEDPSAVNNGGDLGYFTAFQMIYPFEDRAFKTPIGQLSEVFRTRYGYHILKTTGTRPARGSIKAAHLLVSAGKNATQEEKNNAEKKAGELYAKLKAGEKWDDLVKLYSDDPTSNQKGGELPMFGSGTNQRMVPVFEEAAFALKNDGEISAPIQTDFGFHIIKRLEWKPVRPYNEMKKEIQSKVNKDERAKKTQDSFVDKMKKQYNYQLPKVNGLTWFETNLDSTYFVGKWKADKLNTDLEVFSLDGKIFTQKQFAEFMEKGFRGIKRDEFKKVVESQFNNWVKISVLDYEESKLESKYPEFRALIKEYHDGILLYEIMSDKIWNKSVKDTSGLKNFFNLNRANYMWQKRLDATIYECNSDKNAALVYKMLKKKKNTSKEIIEKINVKSELNLRVKMNKFDAESTTYLKGRTFTQGRNKPYNFEDKFYVVVLNKELPIMKKEFNEAKGIVTSDYQNYMEKTWLEELEKKHRITFYYDVLYSLDK